MPYYLQFSATMVCSIAFLLSGFGQASMETDIVGKEGEAEEELTLIDSVRNILLAEGFQGLRIVEKPDQLLIGYENRRYRFEVRALKEGTREVAPLIMGDFKELIWIVQSRSIPLVAVTIPLAEYQRFREDPAYLPAFGESVEATINVESYWKELSRAQAVEPSTYKTVFEIRPELRLALGGFPDAVLHQFNLLPSANVFLWPGMRVVGQAIIPVTNELQVPEEEFVRPGILSASQYFRLPKHFFLSVSGGYFSNYTYGTRVEINKLLLNGDLIVDGAAGYTGYASYPRRLEVEEPERGWEFADLSYFDYQFGMTYRFAQWDLLARVEGGRYLFFDEAVRVSLTRQFDELEITFFALKNNAGENGGFQLSIPLFPPKYGKPGLFQVRPSKDFNYLYHANRGFLESYETGQSFAQFWQKLTPSFVKSQLSQPRDWTH